MNIFTGRDTRILVIATHADDEVLGACGTLFTAIRSGAVVHTAILSTDSSSRDIDSDKRIYLKERRISAANETSKLMGWSHSLHDYPDNAFDTVALLNITKVIEHEIAIFKPSVLLTHFPGDLSNDHQIVSSTAVTAARPHTPYSPNAIIFFETCSSTNWGFGLPNNAFIPNLWIPIDNEAWKAKERAINEYADEMREWPHPRSIEGSLVQAKYRGSEVGADMAEAFIVAKAVEKMSK